jgi:MFS family permease
MIYDPIKAMEYETFTAAYTVDPKTHHDFFVVTISRTFYYMGISVQTFFLYFVHDVIHVYDRPEAAVAILAIVGQCAGAVTCYPVGWLSDQYMGGRRKPFVYMACAILIAANLGMLWCTTLHQMMIVCTFLGAANGMYLTMDTSLAVDTLPDHNKTTNNNSNHNMDSDDKEGEEGSAQLLGIWGVAGFVGSALGPLLGGPLLHVFGSTSGIISPNNATAEDHADYSIRGYCVLLSISAFYFALSATILFFVKRPGV